jgi:hypothetical protein
VSDEIVTLSDTENGAGAGAVAAFVLGGIVVSAAVATLAGVKKFSEWNGRRKERSKQEELKLAKEEAVQTKKS